MAVRTRSIRPVTAATALVASTALSGTGSAEAQVLPTSGLVASGAVSIRKAWWNGVLGDGAKYNGMTIVKGSPTAIVNWQDFSIGQDTFVTIKQPYAQAALLNRVTGDTNSVIAGELTANGQVYLVNPNGVYISRSGRVAAGGGFVASSLDIRDRDFNAGRRQFGVGGGSSSNIVNDGAITVGRGGYGALIGGQVGNGGTISVPFGKVGLGAGTVATLDLSGDGFLQVAAPFTVNPGSAVVSNAGTISADDGAVTLAAAKVREIARLAVNLSGTIEARSVSGQNGDIVLDADYGGGGLVQLDKGARIEASGTGRENGGKVTITGDNVILAGTVDVSGVKGGAASVKARQGVIVASKIRAVGQGGSISLRADKGVIGLLAAQFEMSSSSKPKMKYWRRFIVNYDTYR